MTPKGRTILRRLRTAFLVVLTPSLVALFFYLYVDVLQLELPKTAHLKREHARWEARLEVMDSRLSLYESALKGLEQRDDELYRSIYGLTPIPAQIRNSGLESASVSPGLLDSLGANSKLRSTILSIDALTKRTYIQSKALSEVEMVARQAGDMISCVPSVPPLLPHKGAFRLSSGFGVREDPVYGGTARHKGQDFAAPKGTPVYATGDGVVVKARFQFRGYGNEVIIDHGFGYQTRYAHLNTIEVREGMKVSRGDRIGTVGNSGKSTGYHLHYEVLYMNSQRNPMNYMDINMPETEYRAMIDKRVESSPIGKMSSTSELLNRSRTR